MLLCALRIRAGWNEAVTAEEDLGERVTLGRTVLTRIALNKKAFSRVRRAVDVK